MHKRDLWMLLLILPAVFPAGLVYSLNINHVVICAKVIAMALLMFEYTLKRIPLDKYLVLVTTFLFILLLSTFLNNGDVSKYIIVVLNTFYPVLWCRLSFEENRIDGIIRKLSVLLFLIALIDDIVWVLFPGGIVQIQTGEISDVMGIVSNANSLTPYLIAGCMITLFSITRNKKDMFIRDIIVSCVYTFAMCFVFTGVGIIVSLICIFLLLLVKYGGMLKNLINFKRIVFIICTLFVVFCILRATNWISYFSIALGSSVTFTGRTNLWEYAKTLIVQRPLLGYGVQEDVYMKGYLYRTTPHNMYFQLLIWSGVIGALPIIAIFIRTIKKVTKYWNTKKDIRVLSIGVIGVLIYFLFEVHTAVQIFWMVLSYLNYYDKFENRANIGR